jgi:hypothetical protein
MDKNAGKTCEGNGICISKCQCTCFDIVRTVIDAEWTDHRRVDRVLCTCGHRAHPSEEFCKTECKYNCVKAECKYYKWCGEKAPQWYLDAQEGQADGCGHGNTMFHTLNHIDAVATCAVCLEDKYMIEFKCKHTLCHTCLWAVYKKQIDENSIAYETANVKCPHAKCNEIISYL